jgi:methylmalonyl-CoA mutase
MRIEEAAARSQARIDKGEEVIVGVNKYRPTRTDEKVDILDIDNAKVRESQVARLEKIREDARPKMPPRGVGRAYQARIRHRQPAGRCRRGGAPPRHARRDFRRDGGAFHPSPRRCQARFPASMALPIRATNIRRSRRIAERSPKTRAAAAHAGGQDGPGRPRPRRQGDRHGLRRHRLRRRCRPRCSRRRRKSPTQAKRMDVHVVGVSSQAAGHKTLARS